MLQALRGRLQHLTATHPPPHTRAIVSMQKRSIASYFKPVEKKPKLSAEAAADGKAPTTPPPSEDPLASDSTNVVASEQPAAAAPAAAGEETSGAGARAGPLPPQQVQQPAPAGPTAEVPSEPLHVIADRNMAAANQVVVDAVRRGATPALKDLLVEGSWQEALGAQFRQPYWQSLETFVQKEWGTPGGNIFPAKHDIFRAYNSCPLQSVRVVILGQDPYHGPGQAMGLSFSVPRGCKVPSSLQNMYKELGTDCGCKRPQHGDLQQWANQGVFLLNTTLTVRKAQAGSHQKKGWEQFTDATIRTLSERRRGLVFLLWGNWARQKGALIDKSRHHVLESVHPSGLSANKGFFGCKHFSQANHLLVSSGMPPIDWQIS